MIRLVTFVVERWLALTWTILAAITALSLWPLDALPAVPGTDKTHHFVAYAALMVPTALRKPRYWAGVGLLFVLYSGGIELVQPLVNRYADWMDLLANALGVTCGVLIAELVSRTIPAKTAYSDHGR